MLTSTSLLILWLFAGGPALPRADATEPLRLTVEDVREELGPPPNFPQVQHAPTELGLKKVAPGLTATKTRYPDELISARKLGAAFHARLGLTLGLASEVDGLDAPAFDGLVFDHDDNVVANFSIKSMRSLINLEKNVAHLILRIDQYSLMKPWAQFVLRTLNEMIQHERSPVETLTVHTPFYRRRYEQVLATTRQMIEAFAVETGRPTWILIDVRGVRPLSESEIELMRTVLETQSRVTRLYIYQHGQLTLIRPGESEVIAPDCQGELLAAE